jgi:hypothetical protein
MVDPPEQGVTGRFPLRSLALPIQAGVREMGHDVLETVGGLRMMPRIVLKKDRVEIQQSHVYSPYQ